MGKQIVIRDLIEEDCAIISRAFADQGWNKPLSKYQYYSSESQEDKRVVLVGEYAGQFAGYITIIWESDYLPFRQNRIPEIADFNVLIKYRRRGIGTALMEAVETRIAQRSRIAGIGVGLTADYGAAQVLYVKRGYVPDGRGIASNAKSLDYGLSVILDDHLTLYLIKELS